MWIGIDGEQDITFAYAAAQTDPAGQDYLVGAENASGEGDVTHFLPAADLARHEHGPVARWIVHLRVHRPRRQRR